MSEIPAPAFSERIPPGEDRARRICDHCGFIDYVNPRVVVGAVATFSAQGPSFGASAVALEHVGILLCRRAILPRRGYWTLPAGYLERGESLADGTRREAREEALVELELDALLAVYDISGASQVQVMHRAHLPGPEVGAGEETLESRLFGWDEIPWGELAFHSVSWALMAWRESRQLDSFAPFRNPATTGWLKPEGV
jgi:ADP-ribose pyrophosphatase YjhB (NUDIX family)